VRLFGILFRIAALSLVAALAAVLVYRLVHGSGSGVARAAKAHQQPLVPAMRLRVIWAGSGAWPNGLPRPAVGASLPLNKLRGYGLVLNFWASNCAPCKSEAPVLASAALRERSRLAFVGVDVEDLASDAKHFLRQHHVPYVVVQAGDSAVSQFGLVGLPETFYVDPRGRIQDVTAGPVTEAILHREFAAISD
jgi:thiol-disulfide isomerase/thioredoxin